MAQCRQSPQDFIKNAFTPQIAVMCTPLAEKHCQKNNLSFIELLQPFSKLSNDVHYKDPTGSVVTIRNLKLTFLDVNTSPPQTTLARKYLNMSVSELSDFKTETFISGDSKLNITTTTPWFESWRDTFLKVQYPSDHEYTKHFLSCVLVVSSAEINPVETMIQLALSLNQMQNNAPGKLPKWFSSNVLRYYVLLHDNVEGNIDIANEAYKSLKSSYGESNSFLLRMNSRPPGSTESEHLPDPWSQFINSNIITRDNKLTPESSPFTGRAQFNVMPQQESNNSDKLSLTFHPLSPDTEELVLSNSTSEQDSIVGTIKTVSHGHCLATDDLEQVKLFIHEFCKTCLMPYIERQIQVLNDVISNKKGVSRSLISATKRWFNPNKPGTGSIAINNLIYASDSPELQVRRLGDLYFMFNNYSLAFQAYHLAKRDYNTDQAWLYYAGALEMAALASFMANESNKKTCDYMEESITTYLSTCKMPQFATRATLLSLECLKSRGLYGEAALQLIRMTSEESDLRSALFLEQAAYCFLHSKMVRKYAFHMVLAGHRFSKAAQRKHSLRSYKQAHQVYENSGWDLAEDHIHYTIGRQAHNVRSFDEAVQSFAKLLNRDSKQSAQQQGVFLKEYLMMLGSKMESDGDSSPVILALPDLDNASLKLLMSPTPPLKTPGKVPALGVTFGDKDSPEAVAKWNKLEEILVQEAQGVVPVIFKPMITLYTVKNVAKNRPIAIVNEPIEICVQLVNSLQIVLHLKDIYLLWEYVSEEIRVSNEKSSNNASNYVKTHVTKSVLIESNCAQDLILSLTPLVKGAITLKGICYTLTSSTTPSDSIFITGKQLFNVSSNLTKSDEADINKHLLEITVVPLAPCLQVTFSEISLEFICDEVQKVVIDFSNTGTVPLFKVFMATSVPHLLCNCESPKVEKEPSYYAASNTNMAIREKLIRDNHITSVPLPNKMLSPGQSLTLPIFIKAPSRPGPCVIDLLIYYESIDPRIKPRYRLVKHKWNLSVQESINLELKTQQSYNSKKAEQLALVLKTTNLNKVHASSLTEINLLNVGMLSRYWKLTSDIATPKYINLLSQESAHILLKAERIAEKKSKYTNILLTSEGNRSARNSAYMTFAKKSEYCPISLFDDGDPAPKDQQNGILLLQWQALVNDTAVKRVVSGQTQVAIEINKGEPHLDIQDLASSTDSTNLLDVSLSKDSTESDELSSQSKVMYNLMCPPVVAHDFNKHRLCFVPITLLLHSVDNESALHVTVNTLDPASASPTPPLLNLFYPNASKDFTWVGCGTAIRILQPLGTQSLNLSVAVPRQGTYDLGAHIEVWCAPSDGEPPVLQTCQIQSALIVVDEHS